MEAFKTVFGKKTLNFQKVYLGFPIPWLSQRDGKTKEVGI